MPVIQIPGFSQEPELELDIPTDENRDARIRKFLDVPNWVCECKLTNFGRNKRCAKQKCQRPRPETYIEPEL